MKVGVILLAIVAAVVAQEMKGEAIMRLLSDHSIIGFFNFYQPRPSATITIVGTVIQIPPKLYAIFVQDEGINSIDSSFFIPVRQVSHNVPFRLFYLVVTDRGSLYTQWSCSTATLERNRTNSICDSTIAIYAARNLFISNGIPNFRPIAYGYLSCDGLPDIHRAAIV